MDEHKERGTLSVFNEICQSRGLCKSFIDEKDSNTQLFRATVVVVSVYNGSKTTQIGQWKRTKKKAHASAAGAWMRADNSSSEESDAMQVSVPDHGKEDDVRVLSEAFCHCTLEQANYLRGVANLAPLEDDINLRVALVVARAAFLKNLGIN